jgi:hypothetical protein
MLVGIRKAGIWPSGNGSWAKGFTSTKTTVLGLGRKYKRVTAECIYYYTCPLLASAASTKFTLGGCQMRAKT